MEQSKENQFEIKYISKWKKEIESYGNGNKCVGYSQTTFINEFERDLKELEN